MVTLEYATRPNPEAKSSSGLVYQVRQGVVWENPGQIWIEVMWSNNSKSGPTEIRIYAGRAGQPNRSILSAEIVLDDSAERQLDNDWRESSDIHLEADCVFVCTIKGLKTLDSQTSTLSFHAYQKTHPFRLRLLKKDFVTGRTSQGYIP